MMGSFTVVCIVIGPGRLGLELVVVGAAIISGICTFVMDGCIWGRGA